jgi:hypothetical protein
MLECWVLRGSRVIAMGAGGAALGSLAGPGGTVVGAIAGVVLGAVLG